MKKKFLIPVLLLVGALSFHINTRAQGESDDDDVNAEWCDNDYDCCREGLCCAIVTPKT